MSSSISRELPEEASHGQATPQMKIMILWKILLIRLVLTTVTVIILTVSGTTQNSYYNNSKQRLHDFLVSARDVR